ncbi:MAG: hypothetical protein ACXVRJ_13165 [Gaiellaceae bacterium]
MSERTVRRLLDATPVDQAVEVRAWAIVQAAHAAREPVPRRPHTRAGLMLAAVTVAIAAAALSPPGRAVVHAVRKSIGIAGAQPALFQLPAPGRVLVSGPGGTWVVAADGSKRRLGDFREAAWSPHALYVVASSQTTLAALEPSGKEHWTLERRDIRFPRWGGGRADTRIAYLTAGRLHVVAGDGTGDAGANAQPAAALVAPAWRPPTTPGHVLAYVTTRGRVVVLDTDRRSIAWISHGYAGPQSLAWSPDAKTLVLAAARTVVFFDPASGARARSRSPAFAQLPSPPPAGSPCSAGTPCCSWPAHGCGRSSPLGPPSLGSPGRRTAAGCSPACPPPTSGSFSSAPAHAAYWRFRTCTSSSAGCPRLTAGPLAPSLSGGSRPRRRGGRQMKTALAASSVLPT